MKTALITGASGQDGSYLSELLSAKGYRAIGVQRIGSAATSAGIQGTRIERVSVDLHSFESIAAAVEVCQPDEIYNLGGMASSNDLFGNAEKLMEANAMCVIRWLEAIRLVRPRARFCQASSSEMFGNASETPQRETTCFRPRNPYGIAKLCAHHAVGIYRDCYNVHASSAILFNHESPRRGVEFVTRKITQGVARVSLGLQQQLVLGNLSAKRDWGYAPDYVAGMWMMLQQDVPEDYILATGRLHSVEEFCEVAFRRVGLDYRKFVIEDAALARRVDASLLCGDPAKARERLGWTETLTFEEFINAMVDEDVQLLKNRNTLG